MKRVVLTTILIIATSAVAVKATSPADDSHYRSPHPTVGAPLDGLILLGLGAAGAAYYTARKKKRSEE